MTTLRMTTLDQVKLMDKLLQPPPLPPLLLPPRYCKKTSSLRSQQTFEEEDPHPILLRPTPSSYNVLLETLSTINFDPTGPRQPCHLPPDLVKRVLSFLTVKRVQHEHVLATNCSSSDGIHPLQYCLWDNENTWWLSRHGSMPGGRGQEWVQFQLCRRNRLCRLSSVSLNIHPMPQGPLSVRDFLIQAFHLERGWHPVTPVFSVGNRSGWQTFGFPEPVDVDEVRLVCLSNQIEEYMDSLLQKNPNDENILAHVRRFESVGFFSVKFE